MRLEARQEVSNQSDATSSEAGEAIMKLTRGVSSRLGGGAEKPYPGGTVT